MTERSGWWRGARGEWYVVAQLVLLALVAVGPRSVPGLAPWPVGLANAATWLGGALATAGALLLIAAVFRLGSSLTALPEPKADAALVTTGPYAVVRHPIYAALILLAVGWAMVVHGTLTMLAAAALALLLDRKAAGEERRLVGRFPQYSDYRRRVRKLVPFLY